MKPSAKRSAPASPRGGRLTAEQQLAMQKKEKKGAKARKELLAEEEKNRDQLSIECDTEFDVMMKSKREDLDITKDRLIRRLTSNLDELRTFSSKTIRNQENDLTHYRDAITSFCRAFANDGVVDGLALRLIQENRPASEVSEAIIKLGQVASFRLRDNEKVARESEKDLAITRQDLRKTKEQLCAAETIIASKHVTSSTEYSSAAELFRSQGQEFEARMFAIEDERRQAFNAIIRAAAEPKYHVLGGKTGLGQKLGCLDEHPAEAIFESYLSSTQRSLVHQSNLLIDLQKKIAELTDHHIVRSLDRIRRDRTNFPSDVCDAIAEASRDELVSLLNFVSFEPRVSEAVASICRNRLLIEQSSTCLMERAPHDVMTSAALSTTAARPLAALPPRIEKVAFTRATLIDAAARARPGFGFIASS